MKINEIIINNINSKVAVGAGALLITAGVVAYKIKKKKSDNKFKELDGEKIENVDYCVK